MIRGGLFVEGKGETTAAPVLLQRLWAHLGLTPRVEWEVLYRGNNLKNDGELRKKLDRFRPRFRRGNIELLMIMFDSDLKTNGAIMCPRDKAPATADIVRAANLPIPAAVVLPYMEYEHWFVASLPVWAGRDVMSTEANPPRFLCSFASDTSTAAPMLNRRDAKGPIDQFIVRGEDYRETTHQLALTEMLDFTHLEQFQDTTVPSYGSLRRACERLAANPMQTGFVSPPPKPVAQPPGAN